MSSLVQEYTESLRWQLIVFIVVLNSAIFAADVYKQETIALAKELRCMVCQGQSIADSDAQFAQDIRRLIDKKVQQGESKEAIKTDLLAQYGEAMSLAPSANHTLLWYYPSLLMVFIISIWAYQLSTQKA